MGVKICKSCKQPMLPKGVIKRPNEYDHAGGCPEGKACISFRPMNGARAVCKNCGYSASQHAKSKLQGHNLVHPVYISGCKKCYEWQINRTKPKTQGV